MAAFEKAVEIAARAHAGQRDKEGRPYLTHALRVTSRVAEADPNDLDAQIVAVLHDVVEDSDVTFDDLRAEGFSERILAALKLVTHGPDQTYADYVVGCAADPIARRVKLADLHDNTLQSRTMLREGREEKDLARMRKYALAYQFLTERIDEAAYRRRMADGSPALG
ncbi:HD domain-containing protein [Alienimonas californiensis]|uniref:Bifunctional (P)ppGpp synthase/hydrolase relA n=1 Tax=Alienimonas californiensis TaxID=2527989 RepID=A0A517P4V3_9PLAN|nr:HD domain-containing protein [Alienimonas californiensis]QDT14409.1 Bifunctional (p)ppGpp synthase/hydrolase relA [Alienimonas californiensis]